MPNLTKKQKQVLDFITQFIQTNEYSPSYREIAEYFGLSSTATVHEHIKSLEDKGLISSSQNAARSLEVISKNRFGKSIELPLAGLITAGVPIEAIETNETIAVPQSMISDENSFVFIAFKFERNPIINALIKLEVPFLYFSLSKET